jgi:hypothetical protein
MNIDYDAFKHLLSIAPDEDYDGVHKNCVDCIAKFLRIIVKQGMEIDVLKEKLERIDLLSRK